MSLSFVPRPLIGGGICKTWRSGDAIGCGESLTHQQGGKENVAALDFHLKLTPVLSEFLMQELTSVFGLSSRTLVNNSETAFLYLQSGNLTRQKGGEKSVLH